MVASVQFGGYMTDPVVVFEVIGDPQPGETCYVVDESTVARGADAIGQLRIGVFVDPDASGTRLMRELAASSRGLPYERFRCVRVRHVEPRVWTYEDWCHGFCRQADVNALDPWSLHGVPSRSSWRL